MLSMDEEGVGWKKKKVDGEGRWWVDGEGGE
jgi:hypothetical protein